MSQDETEIRQLVATWMSATRSGDIPAILELMTDDVIFLTPGRAPMRKDGFASVAKTQAVPSAPKIDAASDIQEIEVCGDLAFACANLTVLMIPADGTPAIRRTGNTLTIFRKIAGQWKLARDANLLGAPEKIAQ